MWSAGEIIALLIAIGGEILGILCAAHALLTKYRKPTSAMAWILLCLVLPLFGGILYLAIGLDRVKRQRRFRVRMAAAMMRARIRGKRAVRETRPEVAEWAERVGLEKLGGNPLVGGNTIESYLGGEEAYEPMLEAIAAARERVSIQFFIFDDDRVGRRFREALMERARAGVKVRMLYDAVGCNTVPNEFWEHLAESGAEVSPFMPLAPLKRRWQINMRNHRKILVVDGEVGFTGSMNVSARHLMDEGGTSYDVMLRIRGPALRFLERAFARDWYFATERAPTPPIAALPDPEVAGDEAIQVVESGPDSDAGGIHDILVTACHQARESILLVTPYFIPDPSLLGGLETAAARGVSVRLLVPERTDNRLVNLATRNYTQPLMEAGVRIYEKPPPMIHVKAAIFDERLAIVGSSNLDNRSFFLNFEVDLVIPGTPFVTHLHELLEREIESARLASVLRDRDLALPRRLLIRLTSLFAPLL